MIAALGLVLLAALAGRLAGALWYALLGNRWLAALGTTREALARPPGLGRAAPFLLAFATNAVLAWVLGLVMFGTGAVGMQGGLMWAAVLWMAFILLPMATGNSFARRPPALTLIDAGHWLLALLAIGTVLGMVGWSVIAGG